jgi:hypothetical protein
MSSGGARSRGRWLPHGPASSRARGFSRLQGLAAQVIAVELDKVKGIEEDGVVVILVPNALEHGDAVVVARYGLAIDDAGVRAQLGDRRIQGPERPRGFRTAVPSVPER